MTTQDAFTQMLMLQDEVGSVVRSHIHIEGMLNELVELRLIDPAPIKKANFNYEQTCILVIALGLDPLFLPPLKALGNIRNAFAHDLKTRMSAGMMNDFYKSFSPDDKALMNNIYRNLQAKGGLSNKISLSKCEPRDRFSIYALTLRAALAAAIKEAKEWNEGYKIKPINKRVAST